jgi:Flp pilus assembly protein TadG
VTDRGSLTVEAALVLPVILLVLVACFELASLALTRIELVAAAREGARVAASVADPARAVAATRAALTEPLNAIAGVSVKRPQVSGRQAVVVVEVRRRLRTPLLDWFTVPIVVRAVMVVEP